MVEFCDKPQIPGPADVPCGLDKGHQGLCQPNYKHRRKAEPREPAAREAAFTFAVAQGVTDGKYLDMQLVGEKFGGLFAFMEAYSAELRAALKDQTFWADEYHKAAIASEASWVKAREALEGILNILLKGHHYTSFRNAQAALYEIKKIVIGGASTSAPEGTV